MALTKKQKLIAELDEGIKITPELNITKAVADTKVAKGKSPEYYEGLTDALNMMVHMLKGPPDGLPGAVAALFLVVSDRMKELAREESDEEEDDSWINDLEGKLELTV